MLMRFCIFFGPGLDPPRDLKVQNVDPHSATIAWRPPRGAITEYVLSNTGPGSGEVSVFSDIPYCQRDTLNFPILLSAFFFMLTIRNA